MIFRILKRVYTRVASMKIRKPTRTLDILSAIFIISIKSITSSSLTIKKRRLRSRSTILKKYFLVLFLYIYKIFFYFARSVIWITISTSDFVRFITPENVNKHIINVTNVKESQMAPIGAKKCCCKSLMFQTYHPCGMS